jgi:hypothetical protein
MTSPAQINNPMEPVLRTITRDRVTYRARDIRPGEQAQSIWDELHADGNKFVFGPVWLDGSSEFRDEATNSDAVWKFFYNDGDAAEDAVLFEAHLKPDQAKQKFQEISNSITKLEKGGPVMARFVLGLDPDEEVAMEDLAPLALKMRTILENPFGKDDDTDGEEEWESTSDKVDDSDDGEGDENNAAARVMSELEDDGADNTTGELRNKVKKVLTEWKGPKWDTGINELMDDADGPWDSQVQPWEEEFRCRALIQSWQPAIEMMREHGQGTQEEFRRQIDRERAIGM